MSEVVLAVDLGAGSLRVGAVTARGRLVAAATVPIEAAAEPSPGWSEIDPELWWRALTAAVGKILDRLPRSRHVVGICIAGLTRSQIFLDAAGKALRPAILFRDRRAHADALAVAQHFATDNPADAITAFHPLARLAWLVHREPETFGRLAAVAEPKDFLNFRLTGRLACDSVTASRLDALGATRGVPSWLQRCVDLLATEAIAPWALLGPATCAEPPFDRLAGVPVFAGSIDAWASAVGAGAVRPGQAYDVAGTSEVVGLIGGARVEVRGLVSLIWGETVYQIGGPTQAGADCARWSHQLFRLRGGLAAAIERAGRIPPSAKLPVFLPYLAGERAPLWRDELRGAFHFLSRALEPDDFLAATLEGVALAVRDILTTAATACGEAARELRVCGGGARSDAWCQLKADVTGLPVHRAVQRETGLLGCAIAAMVGLGHYPDLASAADAMSATDRVFPPQRGYSVFYADRFFAYRRLRAAALAFGEPAAPGAQAARAAGASP